MGKFIFSRKPDSEFPADVDFIGDEHPATAATLM
jgi:hypothetical protein